MGLSLENSTLKLSPQIASVAPERWSNSKDVKEGVLNKP